MIACPQSLNLSAELQSELKGLNVFSNQRPLISNVAIEMFFNLWKAGKLCPPNRHSPVFALVGGLFHSSIYDRHIITPELYQFLLTEEGLNKTCRKHLIKKTSPSEVRGCLIIIWTGLNIKIGIVQKVYE